MFICVDLALSIDFLHRLIDLEYGQNKEITGQEHNARLYVCNGFIIEWIMSMPTSVLYQVY